MSKIIEFVTYNGWGHAIHAHTMHEVKNYGSWLTRLIDRAKKQYRKSVMVHSSQSPNRGDKIHYKVDGGIREAEIYDIDWCRDPDDMYTLYLLFRPQTENPAGYKHIEGNIYERDHSVDFNPDGGPYPRFIV